MKLPKFKIKSTKNIYLLALILFGIWMLFFDNNSLLIHSELNKEIHKLETEKAYYLKEIKKDNNELKKLNSDEGLEIFAREEYFMKRDNEDIYIIEFEDSLKTKNND